ncbi:hemin uptake protein HemP [Acidovorax sp. HDW3]|uniref:hemin uptake protein HemP n=1 Tax=Acidovorax sp. HDW3 TaxID=2714923 RepID=UPI0014078BF7|nr:hemin uptake protein HemP [Acidovorax sp. HDW3]QIL44011.1 hemin uptake protein HemP [Acidovorax sp. HDW3]
MQAALSSPHPATSAAPVLSGVLPPTAAVDSQALLQGQKAITITHNGAVYRLQATKLGKLILTK